MWSLARKFMIFKFHPFLKNISKTSYQQRNSFAFLYYFKFLKRIFFGLFHLLVAYNFILFIFSKIQLFTVALYNSIHAWFIHKIRSKSFNDNKIKFILQTNIFEGSKIQSLQRLHFQEQSKSFNTWYVVEYVVEYVVQHWYIN